MKTTANTIFYTLFNVRYASLILPTGVVAYLAGIPAWMVIVAAVFLGLAATAELFASAANGLTTAHNLRQHDEVMRRLADEAEKYANGGWVGLGNQGEDADEEGREDGGEASVPAK